MLCPCRAAQIRLGLHGEQARFLTRGKAARVLLVQLVVSAIRNPGIGIHVLVIQNDEAVDIAMQALAVADGVVPAYRQALQSGRWFSGPQ